MVSFAIVAMVVPVVGDSLGDGPSIVLPELLFEELGKGWLSSLDTVRKVRKCNVLLPTKNTEELAMETGEE
jgi:hypothetical protein